MFLQRAQGAAAGGDFPEGRESSCNGGVESWASQQLPSAAILLPELSPLSLPAPPPSVAWLPN